MPPVLAFESVSKRYRSLFGRQERWALRDFSLQVQPGEIVGFLGPNGAGKTTALHIAMGLSKATRGTGTILGRSFHDVSIRKRVGFLSESPAFYHQSARDVIKFCGALNGIREPALTEKTTNLLHAVGLLEEADRNIGKFSRGMLQRVGIAQALINDPELLVLDEPTSALDPLSRLQVRELILRMRAQGKSVFLSSHQLSEVELVCDRVVFVREGHVIASGVTHDLLQTREEFQITATGVSTPPTSARDVRCENDQMTFTVASVHQRQVIEQIWSAGGTVLSVNPKTRTLEHFFLDLLGSPTPELRRQ